MSRVLPRLGNGRYTINTIWCSIYSISSGCINCLRGGKKDHGVFGADQCEQNTASVCCDIVPSCCPCTIATENEQMETTTATTASGEQDGKPEETKDEEENVTQEGGGVKRQHEDEEPKVDGKDDEKSDKVDPSKAPDPEEPEKFDESAIKNDFEDEFKPPEDDVTITLDRCKERGR